MHEIQDSIAKRFKFLAVRVDRVLSEDEVSQVSGCIGWALSGPMAGCQLSDPLSIHDSAQETVIIYACDSDACYRTVPSIEESIENARNYLVEGTPIYKTNRVGPKGSRAVEGIGPCQAIFATALTQAEVVASLLDHAEPTENNDAVAEQYIEEVYKKYGVQDRKLAALRAIEEVCAALSEHDPEHSQDAADVVKLIEALARVGRV